VLALLTTAEDAGRVMRDEKVTVTAALVDHPATVPALAYRFDGPDRSIVISGDTVRSSALVELARGADVLVHNAAYTPAIDRLVAGASNAAEMKRTVLALLTTAEDAGRVAREAGVGTLVLSHLVPSDPTVTDAMWQSAAAAQFSGRIVVGRDLLEP
jgi:ribonuclease BN (tRNA processing enzyme)